MILRALALRLLRFLRAAAARASDVKAPLSFSIAILVIGLAISPLAAWRAERNRDAWWVKEIRAKSGRVVAVVNDGNVTISAEDAKAIKEIDDARIKALDELSRLKIQRSKAGQLSSDCMRCSIPLDYLRLRQ